MPMPNPIDFSYVFANANFADNITIYLTIIITLSLYIIGLIYARLMVKDINEVLGWYVFITGNNESHEIYL